MRIYAPYCWLGYCGQPLENCRECTEWLQQNVARIQAAWREWLR